MGTLVRRKKSWRNSARKVTEFGQLTIDILVDVFCKFEMNIFKIAQVINEHVRIAFLYVLSIYIICFHIYLLCVTFNAEQSCKIYTPCAVAANVNEKETLMSGKWKQNNKHCVKRNQLAQTSFKQYLQKKYACLCYAPLTVATTKKTSIRKKKATNTMSLVMRKPAFCLCENKDADQLRGNREADQRLCFRYIDSTIPLLSKSEISSL